MKQYRMSLHQNEFGLYWVIERRKMLFFWKVISEHLSKKEAEMRLKILKNLFEKKKNVRSR